MRVWCTECGANTPEKLFFYQDTEIIAGCSDCMEFALFGDEQYEKLAKGQDPHG